MGWYILCFMAGFIVAIVVMALSGANGKDEAQSDN